MKRWADEPLFGVAGFPPNFFKSPYKKRESIFEWLHELGLDWIELQNTYGVKMKSEQAAQYRQLAAEYGIGISIHGPYYISLASGDTEVVARSKKRILQCFRLAEELGTTRIIFHPGFYPGSSEDARKSGLCRLIDELNALENSVPEGVYLYPETAGKNTQLGSLDEIIQICDQVSFARPCIDLAHVHAFEHGSLFSDTSIIRIFEKLEQHFSPPIMEELHFHVYPVDYNSKGERTHKAFSDRIETNEITLFSANAPDRYYPDAKSFIKALKETGYRPVVICEAKNTQDEGALLMKSLFGNQNV